MSNANNKVLHFDHFLWRPLQTFPQHFRDSHYFQTFVFFQTQLQPPTTPSQTENADLKTCNFSPSVSFPIIFGTLSFNVAIFYGKRTVTTTSNFSKTFSRLLSFSNLFFQPPTTPARADNAGLKTCNFSPSVSSLIIVGDCIRI